MTCVITNIFIIKRETLHLCGWDRKENICVCVFLYKTLKHSPDWMLARDKVEREWCIDKQQESYVGAREQYGNIIINLKLTFLQRIKD